MINGHAAGTPEAFECLPERNRWQIVSAICGDDVSEITDDDREILRGYLIDDEERNDQ